MERQISLSHDTVSSRLSVIDKIQNLERIITKLKCIKPSDSTKCNFVNATTINFQGTHSELFRHPSVQPKRLENWLPKTINIPKKRLVQKPKTNNADDKGNSNTEVVTISSI